MFFLQWMRKQLWVTPPTRPNRRELVIWNHLEVSPFLNLLVGTRAATNLVLTQVIISESGNHFGLRHKRLTCRILYFDSFVFVIMIILTFHKGKAYSKPIQRRQYVVFCNLKTICCYHAIWATMENCFLSLAKNCPYPKNTNSSLNGHIFHPQQYDFWGKSRMFQRNKKNIVWDMNLQCIHDLMQVLSGW